MSTESKGFTPFATGYAEAILKGAQATLEMDRDNWCDEEGFNLPPSYCGPTLTLADFSEEAKARIIADCERFAPRLNIPADQEAGAYFWDWRQEGWLSATEEARPDMLRTFPPLTPSLNTEGRVTFDD